VLKRLFALAVVLLVLPMAGRVPVGAATSTARPEDVGLSSERLKRITELMQRHIDAKTFPGSVTLVARNGRIAHFEAQGLMDIDTKRPMQKDSIVRIMSMTKPIVGVSILMLMEEGKVRLADPISKFIPELKDVKVAVADDKPPLSNDDGPRFHTAAADHEITIRDVLTHTSGLMSGGISGRVGRDVTVKPGETLAQVLPRLGRVPLDFQPGSRWAYSALYGFDVLARVVEMASGMPFDRFTRARIFDPLGMKDTTFYPAENHPRIATVYRHVDGVLRKNPPVFFLNGTYFSGGGGLSSTAEDYLQFALMLMNGGELNGRRLLSPRTVEMMASVFVPDTLPGRVPGEGFGLSVRVISDPAARNTLLSKGAFGWSGAYNTHFWVDPKAKIVGILMTQIAQLELRGQVRDDFETAVMQAVVGPASSSTN